jgi:hypothetical protein
LFHTREGDLDFGWVILLACVVVGLVVFVAQSFGWIKGPTVAAWAWFGSFTTMAFIAGAAVSRARLIAGSKAPGEVAQGIATAGEREFGANIEYLPDDR